MSTPFDINAARLEAEARMESSRLMQGQPVSAEYSVFLFDALKELGGEPVYEIDGSNDVTFIGPDWCVEVF